MVMVEVMIRVRDGVSGIVSVLHTARYILLFIYLFIFIERTLDELIVIVLVRVMDMHG